MELKIKKIHLRVRKRKFPAYFWIECEIINPWSTRKHSFGPGLKACCWVRKVQSIFRYESGKFSAIFLVDIFRELSHGGWQGMATLLILCAVNKNQIVAFNCSFNSESVSIFKCKQRKFTSNKMLQTGSEIKKKCIKRTSNKFKENMRRD